MLETGKADIKAVVQEIAALGLTTWSEDTVARYAAVGRKVAGASGLRGWLRKSEYTLGENSAFYSITALRALASPSLGRETRRRLDCEVARLLD